MNFPDFKAHISNIKTTKLGGLDAQFKLAPELRLRYNEDTIKAKNPKKAAVLALFYPMSTIEHVFYSPKEPVIRVHTLRRLVFLVGKQHSMIAI